MSDNLSDLSKQTLNGLFGPALLLTFNFQEWALDVKMGDWLYDLWNRANGNSGLVVNSFVQPAVNAGITINANGLSWLTAGQTVFIGNGGFYLVTDVTSTTATIVNLGDAMNVAPGTTVESGGITSGGSISYQSTFGHKMSMTSGGSAVWLAVSEVDVSDPRNIAGRSTGETINFNRITASLGQFAFVAPPPVVRFTVLKSTDGGATYAPTLLTVDVDVATSTTASNISPALSSFGPGSIHMIEIQQLSGGSNITGVPMSVALSYGMPSA